MKIDCLAFSGGGSAFAFTTERGVADSGNPYSEFNCCGYVGDEQSHVSACRAVLCDQIGIAEGNLITVRQVHGTEVAVVDTVGCDFGEADALVTNLEGVAIGVFTADCVPMLFYDKQAGLIGAAHAGWKGTMSGIAAKTVAAMCRLGAAPERVQAVFGPSICRECFEVGDEVVEQFCERGLPADGIVFRNEVTGKAHIDLVAANRYWMLGCGMYERNIVETGLCTKCNPSRFFSARALGVGSGRNLTGILLR